VQLWVFLAMTAGFAVKVPLVPLHTWLPLAHVEAPTAGSVDLAGVLLKVGAYGFLRLCIPLAPDVSLSYGLPGVTLLATIGIVYGAFCAFSQSDFKRLIAYSSVSHLGVCMLGMFSLNPAGLSGSLMQMINHGLSTGMLFLLIGMVYERYHTRQIADYSGMAGKMPLFGIFFVFTCLSSAGLPGLNGFIGEALCLFGIFQHEMSHGKGPILAIIAATSMLLGAWYLWTLMRRLLFGPTREPPHEGHAITDLTPREWLLLAPLAVLCVILGLFPGPVLDSLRPDVEMVSYIADKARIRAGRQPVRLQPVEASVAPRWLWAGGGR
jgi:NADH-quinone oxidoreductase subunit M